jgi:fructokinase
VLVDANVRPAAIADEAAYRARLARMLAHTDVLKASDEDLAWIAPGADPVEAARSLGPAITLLTRGARGASVVTAGDEVAVPAQRVQVVDTIGAGDAFAGAFVARRAQGAGPVEAAKFAARVAAVTCTRAGADPPTRAELDQG